MGNGLYVYKDDDLSQEDMYLNKCLMGFVKELGDLGGVTSQNEASLKRLKWLIKTCQLMDVRTKEEMKVIFCEFLDVLFPSHYFIYLQCAYFSNHYLQIQWKMKRRFVS